MATATCGDENCGVCAAEKAGAKLPEGTGTPNLQDILDTLVPFIPRGGSAKLRLSRFAKSLEQERTNTIQSLKLAEAAVEDVKTVNSKLTAENEILTKSVTQLKADLGKAMKNANPLISHSCQQGKHISGFCTHACKCVCHTVLSQFQPTGWQTDDGIINTFSELVTYCKENKIPLGQVPRVMTWIPVKDQ